HDKPDTLPQEHRLVRVYPANDPPRQIAGYLDHAVRTPLLIGKDHEIALVVLAGVVAERGVKFARGVFDCGYFAFHGRSIDVNIKRRHEYRHSFATALR